MIHIYIYYLWCQTHHTMTDITTGDQPDEESKLWKSNVILNLMDFFGDPHKEWKQKAFCCGKPPNAKYTELPFCSSVILIILYIQ